MQTNFTLAQLADPDVAESEKILRACVHCGFCTATCPTFLLLGDELDSPRGRIYLIKEMLEKDQPASEKVVKHLDRCLSCLSCMTTCPSGVHYMHLIDHGRRHVEETYRRPPADRLLRALLAWLLPRPARFRLSLYAAGLARPLAPLLPSRLSAMLRLAPRHLARPSSVGRPQVFSAQGSRRARVALLTGCAQQVLAPEINEATVRLLTRLGVEVTVAAGAGCCGALAHHLGKEDPARAAARANVTAWTREIESGGLDAVIVNASGCGTMVKDYGFLLRNEPDIAEAAAHVSAVTRDISEFLAGLGPLAARRAAGQRIAYHSACSLQHGQGVRSQPVKLLSDLGFAVLEPAEAHICCGSAGTYNLLQPELAEALRRRKVENLERLRPQAVATGNIGCLTQIGGGTELPVLHTVELIDWATGGPLPRALVGQPAFEEEKVPGKAAAE